MDLLKKFWENPLIKKLIIGTGIFLLIIIFLMIFVSCSSKGKIYSYNEIEKILIQKTKTAYGKDGNLPSLNQKIDISIEELVNKGLVKTINEYTQDETTSCSAKVTIYNNNGYYLYEPNINCGEKYKTKTLQDTLIKDSLVETGNGLYKVDDEYIFKGDNVNNYIKLNDVLYRIISINSDGSVRLMENKKNSASGNIIIQGGVGSGKTMLASNLIKVLQIETDKLTGNVGKIDAEQLNKKDVALVLSKVSGGCLIIEGAGRLSERTQETMRQLMSQENCDVLVLMEDQKKRIDKMLSHNSAFAAMFTEKITIPIFTIDELVNFGKVYALEEGYVVDEMAILAMYNRINLIQRVDHPTSLIEVRDIVESAIDKAEKGGIKAMFSRFGSKRYDEDGNLILREQDFEL